MARHVVGEIVDHGEVRRSRMGVTIQPVTADIARSLNLPSVKGAIVNGVEPGSPADRAGLETGDVITKFNGQALESGNDLRNLVASTAPGSKATVTIVRQGRTQDVAVQLANAKRDADGPRARSGEPGTDDELGLAVEPLTPQLATGCRCRVTPTASSSPASTRMAARPTRACVKAMSFARWTARQFARQPSCARRSGAGATVRR